jgi:hypothetical protein
VFIGSVEHKVPALERDRLADPEACRRDREHQRAVAAADHVE